MGTLQRAKRELDEIASEYGSFAAESKRRDVLVYEVSGTEKLRGYKYR